MFAKLDVITARTTKFGLFFLPNVHYCDSLSLRQFVDFGDFIGETPKNSQDTYKTSRYSLDMRLRLSKVGQNDTHRQC